MVQRGDMIEPNVVIAVPWRSDGTGGRRDQLWQFTRDWLQKYHPQWDIIASDCAPGPFNRGQAINMAAQQAGPYWDVMIVHDADNISDPQMLEKAVEEALKTQAVTMPYEVYIYLNEYSSDQLMAGGNFMFLAPNTMGPLCCGARDHWYNHTVLHQHHSGVQVFPRAAYERVGGFIEFTGWGYEDSVMHHLLKVFAGGITWLDGSALHLWHEHAYDPRLSKVNLQKWKRLEGRRDARQLRQILAQEGHRVP
jgi:hypothetical protein